MYPMIVGTCEVTCLVAEPERGKSLTCRRVYQMVAKVETSRHRMRSASVLVTVLMSIATGACQDLPPFPKGDAVNVPFWGTVRDIDKRVIHIANDRVKGGLVSFALSDSLASGAVPSEARFLPGRTSAYKVSPSAMYRLKDVEVGDLVMIYYSSFNNRLTCDHISILRRPSGRVPPLPEEAEVLRRPPPLPPEFAPTAYTPYHELMNAHWDKLERSGLVLPVAPPPRPVNRAP
jgi:hypothetical protein